jgi:acyl-CoA hydrolase
VFKEDRLTRSRTLATTGHVTMVAIGTDGKPRPVHPDRTA